MGRTRVSREDSYQKYICFVCGEKLGELRGGFDMWLGIRFCHGRCEGRVRTEMFTKGYGRSYLRSKNQILRAIRATKKVSQPPRHEVKCWPKYWADVSRGLKNFDVRKGEDRKYRVGEILVLREFDPKKNRYTGRRLERKIGYVMHGGPFLPSDVWVLGLLTESW